MSYGISLIKNGLPVQVTKHTEGGTYAIGGIDIAELMVTYNYAKYYYEYLDAEEGIRWLYGRSGRECQDRLNKAVEILGVRRAEDYWAPTAGNAGYALSILLDWAEIHPDAVFQGD